MSNYIVFLYNTCFCNGDHIVILYHIIISYYFGITIHKRDLRVQLYYFVTSYLLSYYVTFSYHIILQSRDLLECHYTTLSHRICDHNGGRSYCLIISLCPIMSAITRQVIPSYNNYIVLCIRYNNKGPCIL